MHSMILRGSVACASISLLAACVGEPNAPASCEPMTWTVAAVSGDTTITNTGLRFIQGTEGVAPQADWCKELAFHYEGFLLDGTLFDSSREIDRPLIFTPGFGGLIDGIEQGVIGMGTGGTRRLIISPELGFGSEPRRNAQGEIVVPGNSTVIYDIEVLQVAQ